MTDIEAIDKFMDKDIRPYLKGHYGDVEIVELTEDGILKVKLIGQCNGCPSARFTVEQVIEKDVCEQFPQVNKVELFTQVSEELIELAKKMLSHEN